MGSLYEQGEALYFEGLFAEAEPLLRRAAEAGHVHAAFQLGHCCEQLGREQEAVHWLRVAAEHGDTLAMNDLALRLEDTDRAEAIAWMRRAAEEGEQATAAYNLGIFLEEDGELEEAERWYRRAVLCQYFPATRNRLARLLDRTGRQDEAETWYRTALAEMAKYEEPEQEEDDDNYEANTQIMRNLADLLERTARTEEAHALRRRATDRL